MKYSIYERVCFYDKGERFVGNIKYCHKDNTYNIETRLCLFVVHEKQIRKLKPKKKPREFWIKMTSSSFITHVNGVPISEGTISCYSSPIILTEKPENEKDYIHVKEVLK